MKKNKVLSVLIAAAMLLVSCVSKDVEQPAPEEPVIETPVETPKEPPKESKPKKEKKPEPVVEEKIPEPEPEPEPEEPANIKFAKELQKKLAENDIKGAIALFETIPEELKGDIELKLLLGALYYSDTQFQNAINVANEVLAVDSSNMDALELISLCNHAMGDKKAYQETSKKILAVDPYNTSANIQKAEDLVLNKKYKQAREAYKKALVNDAENKDALLGYAQTSYYIDDIKTAKQALNQVIEQDPENPQANAYLGKIAAEGENYYKAADYVKIAIMNDPYNYDYYLDYGNYLRYQGKFDAAIKVWNKATEIDPNYFLAYAYLAGIYDEQDIFDKALENYHMVIKTNPKYFYAYEETAILEYHAGNYENAIKYFEKAYEYSDSWAYKLMSFSCYAKLGNNFKGKELLAPLLKTMNKDSAEYALVRFFYDNYSRNAETNVIQKVNKEDNSNKRGKMLFYLGLYYELQNADLLSKEYYTKVTDMKAPMFFEYRIAEWGLK